MDDGQAAANICWEDKQGEHLKLLLKYGASTTIKGRDGTSLWHAAAIEDSVIIMKMLVQSEQRDKGLRMMSPEGQTPICAAISAGCLRSAHVLLPYCSTKECWQSHKSIFRDATAMGSFIILKKLVEVGVDLDGVDSTGSPLHFVPRNPDQECVNLLSSLFELNQRSSVNQRTPFEQYISRTLGQGAYANPQIYKLLLPQEALIHTTESSRVWTNICEIVALPKDTYKIGISWGSELLQHLIDMKVLELFETERHSSGVVPLCDAFLRTLAEPDFIEDPQNGCLRIDGKFGILPGICWEYFSAMLMVVVEKTTLPTAIIAEPTVLTALKHAIVQNDLPLVRLLLQNGAEPHTEVDGLSAFEIACLGSLSNDLFTCIIEHSQAKYLQKANKARRGRGPLHYTFSLGWLSQHEEGIRVQNLRSLLQVIEDCDTPNSEQDGTPLFYHVMRGSISTAEVLVEAGANPWKICASTGLNSVMAAVEQAFTWGTIEMITQNETYPPQWKYALKHGETLLHIAARVGNCDCLEVLLDKGIAGHSQTLDNDNSTPMHYAAEYGHTEAIRIPAQREGDANAKTIYGFTPLHVAVKHGQTSTVRVLLEMGAKQFECSNGCTPLAYAYTVGNLDVIEMLTTEANVVQSAGLVTKPKALLALASALRDSVMNDDHVSCERLKNLGCPLDVDVELSGQCMTPLMLAMCQWKSPELIKWLIENGCLISTVYEPPINYDHFSVLDAAIMDSVYVGFLPQLINAFVEEGGDLLSLPYNILFKAIDYREHGALNILLEEDFEDVATINTSA
jgi:ankyrin repeat protein